MDDLDKYKFGMILNNLSSSLNILCWDNSQEIQEDIQCLINKTIADIVKLQQSEIVECDLITTLVDFAMEIQHERVFSIICSEHTLEDEEIYNKCLELCNLKVTPYQLGALEEYSIPLPSALVEIAALDLHSTPTQKFECLQKSFDLLLAQLKGAIVEVISETSDSSIPTLSVTEITPILTTMIIYAKPLHLISNLTYIKLFDWSNKKSNSEAFLAFKTAIDKLKVVTPDMLLPRSPRSFHDMDLERLMQVTLDLQQKCDFDGRRKDPAKDPLEKHVENCINLIVKSSLCR